MKRRTLDIMFSAGGFGLAALLLIIGLVLTSNASFAKNYVREQLSQQQITFKQTDTLTAEERTSACVVRYAGQRLMTGEQAECYANEFIGLHLKSIANADGKTYSELGDVQTVLRAQIAAAQTSNVGAVGGLQKQLADVTAARETVFKGETLRGLLLTSYGFSVLGTKGGEVALVAYIVAALLALLSAAGFVHALRTPRTMAFAVPERSEHKNDERELVSSGTQS